MEEISSPRIRDYEMIFNRFTIVALIAGVVFLACVAAKSIASAAVSVVILLFSVYVCYCAEMEIHALKVIAKTLNDDRKKRVSALYGKEEADEESSCLR